MKKGLIFILIAGFLLISCGRKVEEEILEESEVTIQVYVTPIPDFSQILDELDQLGKVNFSRVIQNMGTANPKSMDKVAFQFGAGIADALVSLKARHKSSLLDITKELIDYANVLGVSEKYLKLSDSMRVYIENENWEEVENQMNIYKQAILDELFSLESYDSVILIQFGGWIRGLQNVSNIMMQDIQKKEATKMLANKTIINALLHDLPIMSDELVKNSDYFQHSLKHVSTIREIIFGSEDGTFSNDEVKKLNQLAKEITANFDS